MTKAVERVLHGCVCDELDQQDHDGGEREEQHQHEADERSKRQLDGLLDEAQHVWLLIVGISFYTNACFWREQSPNQFLHQRES